MTGIGAVARVGVLASWLGRRRSRGQALVEFSLVFPVIALMIFGFIDIGRAVFAYNTLTEAARQATRVAVVNQLDPASGPWSCQSNRPVQNEASPQWTWRGCAVLSGATIGVRAADVSVSYSTPAGTDLICSPHLNVGCIVRVTVTSNFAPITPVAGILIGDIAMSSTSEMPLERLFP
ncbi:MAG TPA: TadE/TadG family type IV pilus assembly protein [Aeromicrobium sp.]|nr:TadE/TadG family type IV pilus assembly protein [Aeromicrobium sp.]